YGDQPGELTDKAAAVFRELKTRERERQMANRFAANLAKPTEADDPEAYGLAWQALETEKAGRLRDAADLWGKVTARVPDEAALTFSLKDDVLAKARWGWLAEKRLIDLKKVDQQSIALKAKIRDNRDYEVAFNLDPGSPEGLAVRALRLEEFGDTPKAV